MPLDGLQPGKQLTRRRDLHPVGMHLAWQALLESSISMRKALIIFSFLAAIVLSFQEALS